MHGGRFDAGHWRVGARGRFPRRQEFHHQLLDEPDDAGGRNAQHQEEQHAESEQAVLREIGQHLGQQHHERGADHRTEGRAGAADHHAEQ